MRDKHRFSVAAARRSAVGLVAVGVLLLAGCGQKGPLTLPKATPAGTAASAPAR